MSIDDSRLDTISVPTFGTTDPAVLYRAADKVLRVMVRNSGGVPIVLAHESAALSQLGTAGTYLLPVGQADIFVLQPKQAILAAAVGLAGQASIAVSVAMPISSQE